MQTVDWSEARQLKWKVSREREREREPSENEQPMPLNEITVKHLFFVPCNY